MTTSSDPATLGYYQNHAAEYVATGSDLPSRWLDGFMARVPAGARILELGCGGGRDSEAMLACGFDVIATDGAAAMAAVAEARLRRPVKVMPFGALDDVCAYDAIWANASLLHVPLISLVNVLSRVFTALKPGGLHVASYKSGDGEGRDGLGRYFSYPGRGTLIEAYASAGYWTVEAEAYVWPNRHRVDQS